MKIIIIGNGVAGISAAESIRKKNKDIEIVMYSDEKYYHYSRPRVIEYLSGKVPAEKIIIKDKEYYNENNIKINLNEKVKRIDVNSKKIVLENGKEDNYDKLIIAAGASSFLPPVKGFDLNGVFTLRTIDDADKIIKFSQNKKRAIVVGGGLLGLESAMSLKNYVEEIYVVEFFKWLLPRQLDSEASLFFQNMIEKKGIKILLDKQTEEIKNKNDKLEVIFKDGEIIETDLILFSAGIKSNLEIVKDTGIEYGRGIKVNEYLETSIKDIYAAGDIAEFNGAVYGIWPAAKEQGMAAGLNASGENLKYTGSILSTKLKITGIDLASIGNIEQKEGIEVITKKENKKFIKIFLKDKMLTGAILIGDTKNYQKFQDLIKIKTILKDPSSLLTQ